MTRTPPTRHPDWPERLAAYLAERRAMPFAWGEQDCCLFVCGAVQAITGRDPAADVRGSYRNERGALRVVKRLGGMAAIGDKRFGAGISPELAQVGDVGLVHTDGRPSLALCGGTHWLAAGEQGIEVLPFNAALSAWRCC